MNRLLNRPRWLLRVAALLTCLCIGAAKHALCQELTSVVAARVIDRDVNTGHAAVGTVMPERRSTIGSAVDGRVTDFLVEPGQWVKAEDVIADLRKDTLEIELAAAEAEVSLRKAELAELQTGSREEEIAEAKAKKNAAEAIKVNAEKRRDRVMALFARNASNESDRDDAIQIATSAAEQFRAAEAAFDLILAGPRPEQIAQAHARLDLAEQQRNLINDRKAKFTITAPYDGFITAEHTHVGAWLSQGDPIVDMVGLESVDLLINVPAEQAVELKRGSDVRIEFPELPGEVLTGRITQIVPLADPRTRTFPVAIRLQNRDTDGDPLLMAGMLGRAVLPTGEKTRLPLVPKDALVLDRDGSSVFAIERQAGQANEGRVRQVPVKLGVADGNLIQVDGPLAEGDLVVVLGNERLRDQQEVAIKQILNESQ